MIALVASGSLSNVLAARSSTACCSASGCAGLLAPWLDAQARPGDLVITLGAGNVQLVCNEVIDLLEKRLGTATKKNLVNVAESSATVAR